MKRQRNGEIWDFEHEMPAVAANQTATELVLGLDGGTTSTVCVCMPLIPFSHSLPPDPLPVLARAVAGCSNHNSVGGKFFTFHPFFLFGVLVPFSFILELTTV
jgi:hypothetical protein